MAEILDQLQRIIHQVILDLGYPGIFLIMLVENLFPPIPSEIVMPFAGFLIAEERMSFLGVLAAGTVGAVTGAVAIYAFGAWMGRERLKDWARRNGKYVLVSERDLDKSLNTFRQYGKAAILVGRVIPGVRSLISIPAGLEGMRLGTFLALTAIGAALWNSLLILAGVFLGRRWRRILELIDAYELVIWVLLGIAIAFLTIRRLRRR